MPESIMSVLSDAPGDRLAHFETGGDMVKPFLYAVNQLVDDARLRIKSDCWHITAVDPANVALVNITLDADAFDEYQDADDHMYGVNVSEFRQNVKRARMRSDDTLSLTAYEEEIQALVYRETDVGPLRFENTLRTIDPDTIRSADLETSPHDYDNLDFVSAELPGDAFTDALSYIINDYEYVNVGNTNGSFGFWNTGDDALNPSAVTFEDVDPGINVHTTYSSDYLSEMLAGINKVGPDTVTLWYGDEIPLFIEAPSEYIDLTYAVAPRVRKDA